MYIIEATAPMPMIKQTS